MTETLRDLTPPLYRPLLGDLFDRPAIVESRATCGECAMCAGPVDAEAASAPEVAVFRPDIKCCSYHPTLPNYLVGAALLDPADDLAEGRQRLAAKIAGRVGVTPRWLAAPRKYLVLLAAARESSFGRSEALLCPYFERPGGTCSIWRHRESVCGTFFCKHVAGATGHAFWGALRRYLEHVERTLARRAASEVAPDLVEPDLPRNLLTREDLEDRPPREADYAAWWGSWVGREAAFYEACARRVQALGAEDFRRLVDAGPGADLLAAMRARLDEATSPRLAARLVRNPDVRVAPAEGGVGVVTYSRYDALFLTKDLFDLLGELRSDETVAELRARMLRDHDVDVPEDLLLTLQLHGVLIAGDR